MLISLYRSKVFIVQSGDGNGDGRLEMASRKPAESRNSSAKRRQSEIAHKPVNLATGMKKSNK